MAEADSRNLSDAHTQMPSLQGRKAVITGGTTGIGRAIGVLLASEGVEIFTCGRNEQHLADGLQRINEVGKGDGISVDLATREGLGWIPGEVRAIERTDPAIKVPHMGWNDVSPAPRRGGAILIEPGEAYFLHSYHFRPEDGRDIAAMSDHGGGLVAAVARDNIVGVQFHPEKSQDYGLALLARFLEWNP